MIKLVGPLPSLEFGESLNLAFDELLGDRAGFTYQVEVSHTSPDEMAAINRQYRHIDAPTDVLSFPIYHTLAELPAHDALLGDLVICPDMTGGKHLDLEECYIHGILHLLGYDHEKEQLTWNNARKRVHPHS